MAGDNWIDSCNNYNPIGRMVWVPLSDNGRSAECWAKVRDISIVIDERDDGVSSVLEPPRTAVLMANVTKPLAEIMADQLLKESL